MISMRATTGEFALVKDEVVVARGNVPHGAKVVAVAESRSGGAGHVVSERVAKDGSMYLTCSCPGGRFAFAGDRSGRGCWFMQQVRAEQLGA